MVKKLTTNGNSVAVVLDREVLKQAQMQPGDDVSISVVGTTVLLQVVRGDAREEHLAAARKRMHTKFGRAFKRLAE